MKAFTIDAEMNIRFFDTKAEAAEFAEANLVGMFTSPDQLELVTTKLPVTALAEIYNSFTGVTEVKTFPSRKAAISRIWAECRKMSDKATPVEEPAEKPAETATAAAPVAQEAPEEKPATERKARKAKAAKGPKTATTPKVRAARKPSQKVEPARIPRKGTKLDMIRSMILRPGGATEAQIIKATGWKGVSGTVGVIGKTIPGFEYYKPEKGGRGFRVRPDHAAAQSQAS